MPGKQLPAPPAGLMAQGGQGSSTGLAELRERPIGVR